jgi:hypothetical protein
MHRYKCYNAAMPTTAAPVKVTTGTAIKTMLQISTPATRQLTVVSYGISFDGSAAATPGTVELIQTDVAATVTAHAAAGVMPLRPGQPASLVTLGTANTGFTATAEGTTTASRLLDAQLIAPTNQFVYQWIPKEEDWTVAISTFLRVRVTFGAAINALCWVVWDE